MSSKHDSSRSSYREILIEHLLVGELMRRLWLRGITDLEVLQPQVDDSGYDVVLEAGGTVRHVQLKSSFNEAKTSYVKASLKLLEKPSACVVWVYFAPETLQLGPFLWFGGSPGEPLPDITDFRTARHTRANSKGVKKERLGQRNIPRSKFEAVPTVDALLERLFGEF